MEDVEANNTNDSSLNISSLYLKKNRLATERYDNTPTANMNGTNEDNIINARVSFFDIR
jgi:hypothetical protein